jgi:MFS family permease
MSEPRPSSRYAWYVVFVVTLASVSGWIDRQIFSLLVPTIKHDLALTDTQISYLGGFAFTIFYAIFALPIARLADRASRRDIMAAGVALWSLFTAACGTAGSYARLFLFRVGVGVGEATLEAPSVSLLADYFPREQLGRAMGIYTTGVFFGSGLSYAVGGAVVGFATTRGGISMPLLGELRPWQLVFVMVGLPGLLVSLLFLTVREPARTGVAARRPPLAEIFRYIGANRRTFTTLSFGFAASATVNYAIAFWLATFLVRNHGWSVRTAGLVQGSLTMTIGVAATIVGGWAADAYVRRGRIDAPLRMGMIGAAGMLVSATAYPLASSATAAVAWLAVVNFFAAFPWGAARKALVEAVPAEMRAQGAALYFLVLSLFSSALGPSLVAWCTDYVFHDDAAVRYSLAIVNVAGMTVALALFALGLASYRETVARRDELARSLHTTG